MVPTHIVMHVMLMVVIGTTNVFVMNVQHAVLVLVLTIHAKLVMIAAPIIGQTFPLILLHVHNVMSPVILVLMIQLFVREIVHMDITIMEMISLVNA